VVADRHLVVPDGDGAVLLEPDDHLLAHVALAVAHYVEATHRVYGGRDQDPARTCRRG
jgi:hypothetical protein